ncbi:MAG: PD40 domain-containing protein [Chloroflexi bacterium]|nr:PD40 domain-containing protein [Chloroflexota bacterium]
MQTRYIRRGVTMALLGLFAPTAAPGLTPVSAQSTGTTTRVSVRSDGTQASGAQPAISTSGRYVAFASGHNGLVPGDTNGVGDIFVHDRDSDADGIFDEPGAMTNTRVSVRSDGTQANGVSQYPSISANGRHVAFVSDATNLVTGDTNGRSDIFVHDRDVDADGVFDEPGQVNTTRVSVPSDGTQGTSPTAYGAYYPSISADGRYVTFYAAFSNLVAGDWGNYDIFVHDRDADADGIFDQWGGIITTLVSVHSNGTRGNADSYFPSISADGRYISFYSLSTNLIGSDLDHDGYCETEEGCDTNGARDIFVYDRQTGQTTRESVRSNGAQSNHDSYFSSISGDGRYVAFSSFASNLVDGDTNNVADVFVRDRQMGQTTRVSVHSNGTQGNGRSAGIYTGEFVISISADGRYVAYTSEATNLSGEDDTNGKRDVFVHNRQAGQTTRVSVHTNGTQGNNDSDYAALSGDGRYIAFHSLADNLVSGDTNGAWDVFVRDRGPQIDLSVDSVIPIQVLEGQPLVKDKATAVKAVIRKNSVEAVNNVSAQVTYGTSTLSTFYVADAANINAQYALVADNATYPLNFATTEVTKTIYFFGSALAPTGSAFQASVTVDSLGAFAESDETNNTTASASVAVHETNFSGWALFPALYLNYFRADWGATPLADFDSYYLSSAEFIKGVYPISAPNFRPSKSLVGASTTAYRGGDGKLSNAELINWWQDALTLARLAKPGTDRFVAAFPQGWFAATTTQLTNSSGVSYRMLPMLVLAESGANVLPNGESPGTVAHEIGHSYGLDRDCEEYDACNPNRKDNIGNYAATGLWVEKRIPIEVTATRKVYCFMGATANEFWIDAEDYAKLLNDQRTTVPVRRPANNQAILAVGTFYGAGAVTLDNWYVLSDAKLTPLATGPYTFEYQDAGGGVLDQINFGVSFTVEGSSTPLTEAPFVFTIPYVAGTRKIVVKYNGTPQAEKLVSANAPTVTVTAPNGGETLNNQTTVQWTGSDVDGGPLYYAVLYSADNGANWETLAADLTATNYAWNLSGLPVGSQYRVKVLATDGFNTGDDVSNASFAIGWELYLPLIRR